MSFLLSHLKFTIHSYQAKMDTVPLTFRSKHTMIRFIKALCKLYKQSSGSAELDRSSRSNVEQDSDAGKIAIAHLTIGIAGIPRFWRVGEEKMPCVWVAGRSALAHSPLVTNQSVQAPIVRHCQAGYKKKSWTISSRLDTLPTI
jgi:hypothetical protein